MNSYFARLREQASNIGTIAQSYYIRGKEDGEDEEGEYEEGEEV